MNDINKIVELLEKSGLLIAGATENSFTWNKRQESE